jgi:hypothetical protein
MASQPADALNRHMVDATPRLCRLRTNTPVDLLWLACNDHWLDFRPFSEVPALHVTTTNATQGNKAGADEALMLDPDGFVATCNSVNFFCVRKGEVWAPQAKYQLQGITRANVLKLCRQHGVPCRELDFTLTKVGWAPWIACAGAAEAAVAGAVATYPCQIPDAPSCNATYPMFRQAAATRPVDKCKLAVEAHLKGSICCDGVCAAVREVANTSLWP